MSLKVLFFIAPYPTLLDYIYDKNKNLSSRSFAEQYATIMDDFVGVYKHYANNLDKLGYDTNLIMANCKPLQYQWAKENNFRFDEEKWEFAIALEQVKRYKPDIFYMSSIFNYYNSFLDEVKNHSKKIITQIACKLPKNLDLTYFDCILTCAWLFYLDFKSKGITTEYFKAAFEPETLKLLTKNEEQIDFSFIGTMLKYTHPKRLELLKELVNKTDIKIWGRLDPVRSPPDLNLDILKTRYQGSVYGLDMLNTLYNSKMTFNSHIDATGEYAGNMRLYEATGVGTLLITDMKQNISDLFVPGKEVVVYTDANDLLEKVDYYRTHTLEREEIALAGQKRTLKDHNFMNRAKKLDKIFNKLLS